MKKTILVIVLLVTVHLLFAQGKGIQVSSDSTYLSFAQNGKVKLPNWVFLCGKIREVNLSNQPIEGLYSAIEQLALMDSVKRIIIQNANLKSLPYNIYKVKNLQYMDLRGNRLQSLPYSIRYCSKLEALDLDNNVFQSYGLISIFKNVPALEWLSVNSNQLSSLPAEICLVNKLMILSISDNKISELPECIYTMKSLRQFVVKGKRMDRPQPESLLSVSEVKEKFLKNGLRLVVE